MRKSAKSSNLMLRLFGFLLGITILIWLLRGVGVLTFIPGGVILLLMLGVIAVGIWSRLQRRWNRF